MALQIGKEVLVAGLEEGIGHSGTLFDTLPHGQRLRLSACGLVSSAIHAYAQREGVASRLLIGDPCVACDPEMQHVLPVVGEGEDATVLDGAYSLLLGYVGLSTHYEQVAGKTVFPAEKLLCFPLEGAELAVDTLVRMARAFQATNEHPPDNKYGIDAGRGPLAYADEAALRETYSAIYDLNLYQPWLMPERVRQHGENVADYIPSGAIVNSGVAVAV